ncbi:uncharacterized protein BKA78DRAFT_293194 [Phyllosticta capitalensis]|uniref:uncharacterized protein n=1 Tax=Phyllosticta capitalensis TaxID=121624 RepID=UPI0031306278
MFLALWEKQVHINDGQSNTKTNAKPTTIVTGTPDYREWSKDLKCMGVGSDMTQGLKNHAMEFDAEPQNSSWFSTLRPTNQFFEPTKTTTIAIMRRERIWIDHVPKTREEAMIEEMNDRHSKDLPPLHSENEDAEENGFSDLEHQSDTSDPCDFTLDFEAINSIISKKIEELVMKRVSKQSLLRVWTVGQEFVGWPEELEELLDHMAAECAKAELQDLGELSGLW